MSDPGPMEPHPDELAGERPLPEPEEEAPASGQGAKPAPPDTATAPAAGAEPEGAARMLGLADRGWLCAFCDLPGGDAFGVPAGWAVDRDYRAVCDRCRKMRRGRFDGRYGRG